MLDENEEDICNEYYSENINMYVYVWELYGIYIFRWSEGAVDDNGDIFWGELYLVEVMMVGKKAVDYLWDVVVFLGNLFFYYWLVSVLDILPPKQKYNKRHL